MDCQRTTKRRVSDASWDVLAPLIPPEPPKPLGGILLVLRTGMGWQELTCEMDFGSGTGTRWAACWWRLFETGAKVSLSQRDRPQ